MDKEDLPIEEKLPIIEFQYGHLIISREEALRQLGFPDPEKLIEERKKEDAV